MNNSNNNKRNRDDSKLNTHSGIDWFAAGVGHICGLLVYINEGDSQKGSTAYNVKAC